MGILPRASHTPKFPLTFTDWMANVHADATMVMFTPDDDYALYRPACDTRRRPGGGSLWGPAGGPAPAAAAAEVVR